MKKEAIISLLELFPLTVYAVPVIKSNTHTVLDNASLFYFILFSSKRYEHFSYFTMKNVCCGTHWKHPAKVHLIGTNNVCFRGEIKIFT